MHWVPTSQRKIDKKKKFYKANTTRGILLTCGQLSVRETEINLIVVLRAPLMHLIVLVRQWFNFNIPLWKLCKTTSDHFHFVFSALYLFYEPFFFFLNNIKFYGANFTLNRPPRACARLRLLVTVIEIKLRLHYPKEYHYELGKYLFNR